MSDEEQRVRAHQTYERTATQFVKLLATVLGGLGVVLAAWLQRIFEKPQEALLHALMWYLAFALFAVAGGIVLLASTALLDQWHASLSAAAINADDVTRGKTCANRLKPCSHVARIGALACLVLAFATLACGVLSTARATGSGCSVEAHDTVRGAGTVVAHPKR
ncbi:MAG TPA: hypothetical protein VND80_12215 [Steroidobacteraceae bacterium]|nr:hypothetical protein [Steroidobacteraceae bacterium]